MIGQNNLRNVIIFILLISGCSVVDHGEQVKEQSNGYMEAKLISVIDGDTIKVQLNGNDESVRFLLIDTPEISDSRYGEQPLSQEAKAFTESLLKNGNVLLEKDVSERDKYGRLLMYVYTTDGISVQEELLKNGLARVAYIYPPNTKYVDRYRELELQAKSKTIGIWEVEGYAHIGHQHGFHPDVFHDGNNSYRSFSPDDEGECNGQIKGNIGSNGRIYHTTTSSHYTQTKAEECFFNEEDATQAGYRRADG
ncbi:thermonuclease family protein [Salirhabdus salicampi]|uniref:thermonuclease family protein n=1 Tax=Salirhabdus salicampi TaxID=476102 RepID=UPI0020C50192|nr:thermonuclease family protein [Salirhabdus salicampi]MCP8616231.1 thermonuclease family protein [Salirhabdus salicampi]